MSRFQTTLRLAAFAAIAPVAIAFAAAGEGGGESTLQEALQRLGALSAYHHKVHEKVSEAVVGMTCELRTSGRMQGYFGTGVLVSPGGLVLTSTTVVPSGAEKIKVFRKGGEVLDARIVEHDEKTESILVKVTGRRLPYVRLADSSRAEVGDLAYTFGNPYGTISQDDQVSFSVGTISGIYAIKSGDYQSRYEGLVLETDAAVNPGSDGGPLVDVQGRLLGIVSLAYSDNRWLGTAIPIHLIKRRLPSISRKHTSWLRAVRGREARRSLNVLWAVEHTVQRAARSIATAVVRIDVERPGDSEERARPGRSGPSDFWGRRRDLLKRLRRRAPGPVTGVLIDRDGHILTSAYNVSGQIHAIQVTLVGGRTIEAERLGRDEGRDIALLKLKRRPPPTVRPVKLDADARAPLGSFVTVLARSQDDNSLTLNTGIVSATGRRRGTAFQIDALLNSGNSGGPLINLDGRVVGLATHVSPTSPWQQNSGVGFATSTAAVLESLDALKAGTVIRPPKQAFLGISPVIGAMDIRGVRIDHVVPGSAADEAGLQPGDVIVEIGGRPVTDAVDLVRAIGRTRPGEKVTVLIERDGQRIEAQVTLQERPQ